MQAQVRRIEIGRDQMAVLGELSVDRDAAEAMRAGSGSRTRLSRSRLARSVSALGSQIGASLLEPVPEAVE